jgi:glycosyltransferase involved in cell wall biosynthesis
MNITHYVKKENSGLFRTTLELANQEEKQNHKVVLREPNGESPIYMTNGMGDPDVEIIHSQLPITSYHNDIPRFMWMHGEPLSSVGNKVSMKAIVDLAPMVEAFICMREEEHIIWNSIKRTYTVPKGIDLDMFYPQEGVTERLSGEPAVLYIENWRGQRNPLYLCVAMQEVWKKYPNARLHLYNCTDKRMSETFKALIQNNKWWTFIRSLQGYTKDVNALYNRVDIVVSCLYPLYARGIEAFGAGKAFIGPGYKVDDYPYTCELEPQSMANAIINCWEERGKIDFRKWAEDHHDVTETVKQSIEIYERYL